MDRSGGLTMPGDARPFRHLNIGNAWPGFQWEGLALDQDGILRLESLPNLDAPLPDGIADLPVRRKPGGIAVDRDGTIYFTTCECRGVLRVNGCSGETEEAPCLGDELDEPAGVLIPSHRRVL